MEADGKCEDFTERRLVFNFSRFKEVVNDFVLQCWDPKLISKDVKVRKQCEKPPFLALCHVLCDWNGSRIEPELELLECDDIILLEFNPLLGAFLEFPSSAALKKGRVRRAAACDSRRISLLVLQRSRQCLQRSFCMAISKAMRDYIAQKDLRSELGLFVCGITVVIHSFARIW